MEINQTILGNCLDVLNTLPEESIQCCVTSPPYWGLRDYEHDDQLGQESTPGEYINNLVEVFRRLRRVLKDHGTLWLNLADSYATADIGNLKRKNLIGIPWRVALALQADGWYLRSDIIWHKPNPMPESVTDRCTKSHEYMFLLTKKEFYYYNADAIRQEFKPNQKDLHKPRNKGAENYGKQANLTPISEGECDWYSKGAANKKTVWTIPLQPFQGAHFATFPENLIGPCILAGSAEGDIILDPFGGSGTVGLVAEKHKRKWICIELNPEYKKMADQRTAQIGLL